jgi:FkbM family methyltransferase
MNTQKVKSVWRNVKFPKSTKKMFVPNTPKTKRSAVVRRHLKNGSWESHISKILYDNALPNTNVVDIGAFIGTHTLALSDISSKGNGKVYSFEPQPWAFDTIKSSIKKNKIKNVKVYNIALSNKSGTIQFCSDNTGGSTICTEKNKSINSWNSNYNVKMKPLDSYNLKNISIMKIDVEGHEISVLEGALDTIKRNRPKILIEVWNRPKRQKEFMGFMKKINYKVKKISGEDYLCSPK